MITLITQLGNSQTVGPSFSILESRVDEIEILISNLNSLTDQLVSITYENEEEQFVINDNVNENTATALSFSIFLQADDPDDISAELNNYMGVKSIVMELIP